MTRRTLYVTLQTACHLVLPAMILIQLSANNVTTDIINYLMERVHNVIQSANSVTGHRERVVLVADQIPLSER